MDAGTLRAWWAHKQGLDGSLAGATPAEVLARAGWARSVGGANPYLQVFARAGTAREVVDADAAALAIAELPAARGCTYVVPAVDFALALQISAEAPAGEVATVMRLGVPREEIEALCDRVVEALETADGPLDPRSLRAGLGDVVRDLGEEGRGKGLSSTLPVALGLLQSAGAIRRVPANGRLDQQRYGYARWTGSPLAGHQVAGSDARLEIARRFLSWTGGATEAHLRWFTGFSARDVRDTVEHLAPVTVGDGLLALPSDADALAAFTRPEEPSYALVAGTDAAVLLRRDLASLVDTDDAARVLPGGPAVGNLTDLESHAILDRGRLVGLWEFDPDARRIVWWAWVPADDALREAVARTEEFAVTQLGDVRAHGLDAPASRAPRIEALRAAASA